MEGCLSTLIKLIILSGLFVVGLVGGYFYYQGQFDQYLVAYAFESMPKVTPEDAAKQVDPAATPEAAHKNINAFDKRFVRWRGQLSETRALSPESCALTVLTAESPRRTAVVFYKRPLHAVEARHGEEIEVLGQLRKTLVMSEDREGHKFPQVLALTIRRVPARTPPVPGAPEVIDGSDPEAPEPGATPAAASAAPPPPGPPASPAPSASPARPSPARPSPARPSPSGRPR